MWEQLISVKPKLPIVQRSSECFLDKLSEKIYFKLPFVRGDTEGFCFGKKLIFLKKVNWFSIRFAKPSFILPDEGRQFGAAKKNDVKNHIH